MSNVGRTVYKMAKSPPQASLAFVGQVDEHTTQCKMTYSRHIKIRTKLDAFRA